MCWPGCPEYFIPQTGSWWTFGADSGGRPIRLGDKSPMWVETYGVKEAKEGEAGHLGDAFLGTGGAVGGAAAIIITAIVIYKFCLKNAKINSQADQTHMDNECMNKEEKNNETLFSINQHNTSMNENYKIE